MAKVTQDRPLNAFEVNTYEEYREEIGKLSIVQNPYNALLVIGTNGIGKSRTCEELYGSKNVAAISGKPSGWGFYQWVYDNRDKRILMLDDVSKLAYKDAKFNPLLKNLLETRQYKTLRWPTDACDQVGIPKEFTTQSKVIILANTWDSKSSEDYAAIDWRCISILFNPSPIALHHQVAAWFYDQEVYDFIWQNINIITVPNMRLYGNVSNIRRAGSLTWKTKALEMMAGNAMMAKVFKILTDPEYKATVQRIAAFEAAGLGKKSLFYELMGEFKWIKEVPKGPPPKLKLTEPPKEEEPNQDNEEEDDWDDDEDEDDDSER